MGLAAPINDKNSLLPEYLFEIDPEKRKLRRMLDLLDGQFVQCQKCVSTKVFKNGRVKPYYNLEQYANLAIVGEAPGERETQQNMPFVGTSGQVLMQALSKYGFKREHFLMINTMNCRPLLGPGKNGKPSAHEQLMCEEWTKKYFGVLSPYIVLLLGGYATGKMLQESTSITANNATVTELNGVKYIRSIHPAYTIYNRNGGMYMLEQSIIKLKECIEEYVITHETE